MPRFALPAAAAFLTLLFLAGCGDDTEGEGASSPDAADPSSTTDTAAGTSTPSVATDGGGQTGQAPDHDHSSHPPAQPAGPPWPERETIGGNWVLRATQIIQATQQNPQPRVGESPLLLVKITAGTDDAAGAVERITGRGDFEQLDISASSISGDDVSFDCAGPTGQPMLTFRGRFVDGVIGGTMVDVGGNAQFLRLVPTAERTFARLPTFTPIPMAEMEQFQRLANSPVPDEEIRELVRKFPSSPLLNLATAKDLMDLCQADKDVELFEQRLQNYVEMREMWGDRSGLAEKFNSVQLAVRSGYKPDWCIERLGELEEQLKADDTLSGLVRRIAPMQDESRYLLAVNLLDSEDADERAEGRELGEDLIKSRRHHPILTSYLADAARLDGRKEEAIELYAELVALPMQERQLQEHWRNDPVAHLLPSERLGKLWAEVHGGSEGLEEFIQKTYDEKLVSFPIEIPEPREDSPANRTVLLELFTGVQCPYSIAPEVAMKGLADTWPTTSLVTLRYHVHMAGQRIGHDPLTNADTEGRYFNFYKTNLTPRIFLDGINVQGAEGLMVNAEVACKDLSALVKQLLEHKVNISLALTATQQDDTLQINCTASGIGEGEDAAVVPDTARLRLIIAESGIVLEGANGIQQHDMIARKVIGGDSGIAPTDGKVKWQGTVSLEDLRTELHNYLTEYEASVSHQFDSTPLDLKNLSVVAIVQETVSHKVLQCAVVKVE